MEYPLKFLGTSSTIIMRVLLSLKGDCTELIYLILGSVYLPLTRGVMSCSCRNAALIIGE